MSNLKINDVDAKILTDLTLDIQEQSEIFSVNSEAFILKSNKQAAKRARVASLKLAKLSKTYRAESMRISSL